MKSVLRVELYRRRNERFLFRWEARLLGTPWPIGLGMTKRSAMRDLRKEIAKQEQRRKRELDGPNEIQEVTW